MAVQKLRDVVIKMARKHKDIINGQRRNKPLLIADKPLFKEIKQKITHEALNLLLRKWISAGKPVEELAALHQPPPNIKHDICKKECALPIQYSLPCKCFLYYCLVQDKVISPVLIYPRWLLIGLPTLQKMVGVCDIRIFVTVICHSKVITYQKLLINIKVMVWH